jgi:hypothetical protein
MSKTDLAPFNISLNCKDLPWTRQKLEAMDIDDLDWMAYGYIGNQIVELDPSQITIKWHEDLKNPQHKFKLGGMDWVRSVCFDEPVKVSIAQDGTIHLEDGHHRYFAAIKLERTLRAVVEIKGKPIERILEMQEKGIELNALNARPEKTE